MLRSLTAGIVLAFAGSRANVARTILSCAGIVVGVGALIMVVSVSDFGQRFATAYSEANAGRPATLQIEVGTQVTDRTAFEEDLFRAGGQDISLYHRPQEVPLMRSDDSSASDLEYVEFLGVDPELGDIRRMDMVRGRWFTEADTDSLAPVMVVNEELARALGDLTRVQVGSDAWLDVRVVGVLQGSALDSGWYSAYLLRSPASEELLFGSSTDAEEEEEAEAFLMGSQTVYQVRIDPEDPAADDPWGRVFADRLGSVSWRWGVEDPESIMAYRVDYAEEVNRFITYMSWGLLGVAAVTLSTGLLGVLNVGLVTVRERRRELATYRALGASRFTLFVAVVMESVVVSLVAGLIALAGSWILIVAGEAVVGRLMALPPDVPLNIPASGVLVGLGSAALVGLLAGIIPAMRALRASVVAGLRE